MAKSGMMTFAHTSCGNDLKIFNEDQGVDYENENMFCSDCRFFRDRPVCRPGREE